MNHILINLKNRRTAVTFLVLGIWIGITVLSLNISYVQGLKNSGKPLGISDSDYTKFVIGSNEKLDILDNLLMNQNNDMYTRVSIPYSNEDEHFFLVGASFGDKAIHPSNISGRFLSTEDLVSNKKVAIIGTSLKNRLQYIDGKNFIGLKDEKYEVVGITKDKNDSNCIIVPMKSFMESAGKIEIRNAVFTCIQKTISRDIVYNSYKAVLGNNTNLLDMKSDKNDPFTGILTIASIIVVTVAIANIINFTYLWMSERKKEIALRKTVGATDEDIRKLLFYEIGFISSIALVLSIFTGQVICLIINKLVSLDFYLVISLKNVFLSALTATAIVVISSMPSYKEALKIEPALVLKEE